MRVLKTLGPWWKQTLDSRGEANNLGSGTASKRTNHTKGKLVAVRTEFEPQENRD